MHRCSCDDLPPNWHFWNKLKDISCPSYSPPWKPSQYTTHIGYQVSMCNFCIQTCEIICRNWICFRPAVQVLNVTGNFLKIICNEKHINTSVLLYSFTKGLILFLAFLEPHHGYPTKCFSDTLPWRNNKEFFNFLSLGGHGQITGPHFSF